MKKNTKLSPILLDELETLAEDALSLMEKNPEKFTGTAAEIWAAHFNWSEDGKPFHMDSNADGSGDVGEPSLDDSEWIETHLETEITRAADGTETLKLYSIRKYDMWEYDDPETSVEMTKGELSEPCLCRELVQEMLYRHCFYSLLKQSLYNLDSVRTGKDPLNWVYAHYIDGKPQKKTAAWIREVQSRRLEKEIRGLVDDVNRTYAGLPLNREALSQEEAA